MKLHRLLALLLSLAMVLPMAIPMVPVSAEETVVELPTETKTVETPAATLTETKNWDFSDASQLADFSLYQSATSAFTVTDGVLVLNGTDGEVKAMLTDTPDTLQSVSVDILPGASGNIYGGLYFGASGAGNAVDEIKAQAFLIKSDYDPAGWSDAINRIDIVQGEFNNGWEHINTVISETGNGNALFSGSKQSLNLKLVFGGDVVLLTLSLTSNSSKYVQLMYEIDADLTGQIGLRAFGADTKFDNLKIVYTEPVPEGTVSFDFEQSTQLSNFTLYQPYVTAGRMYAKRTGTAKTFWEAVLNKKYTDIKSVSVNMYSAETDRFFGGFFVGGTDKNLDIGFGCRRGNKTRNEIRVHTGTGHMTARTDAAGAEYSDGGFFTTKFNPVNLTLQFEDDKIVATIINLDDTTKVLSYSYAFDLKKFTGEIGLVSDNSNLSFDELTVTYGDGQVDTYNFDEKAQEQEFTYYSPLKSTPYISDGKIMSTSLAYGEIETKAILDQKISDPISVSVDISNLNTTRAFAGLYLGGQDTCWLIECGNRRSNKTRGEIVFKQGTDYWTAATEKKAFEYNKPGGSYGFFSALSSQSVNLTLQLYSDKLVATMTRLDDPTVSLTGEYAWDASLFDGTIGLVSDYSAVSFDNLLIQKDITPDAWDFSDSSQLSDFELYQPAVYNGTMHAKRTGTGKYFWEAVLNQKFTDVQSVSVTMNSAETDRFFGGFFVGGTDKNLNIAFGCRRGDKKKNEIRVHTGAGHLTQRADSAGTGQQGSFFSKKFNSVNLTLQFESDKIIATIVRLDDATKTLSYTYAYDLSKFTGELGLVSDCSNLTFDDFVITYGDGQVVTYNFDNHAQEEDFTFYTPLKSNAYVDGNVSLNMNGMGVEHLGSNAMLKEKVQDAETVSVDISYVNTNRNLGGIVLGGENQFVAIECGNRRSDKTRGEIVFKTGTAYNKELTEKKVFEYNQPGGSYGFYSALASQSVNLTLTLKRDTIVATMTRLDDPSISYTCEYEWDKAKFNGEIGLISDASDLKFDNLTITKQGGSAGTDNTETVYINEGYNFLETDRWSWEFTKAVPKTAYTMEAWVKIPKGTADAKTAYIVDNSQVPPYVSMRLASYGRPNFVYAQEGEEASSFTADVDLRTGKWTHLAYSLNVDTDEVTCYINGEPVSVWEEAGLKPIEYNMTITPHNPYVIGATRNNENIPTSTKFPGWIADVRLWDRALSVSELQDSMMTQYTQPREGLLFNAPLNELVDDKFVDLSGNENYVAETNYKALEWVEDNSQPGAYSMIVVPDHQILANYYPAKLNALYQWIADNREKENIQIVMNVGDMADHCGSNKEWTNTQTALNLLPEDLPYIACPGNHDYDYNSGMGNQNALTLMNQYLPMSKLEGYSTEFGAYSRDRGLEDNVANTWQALEVNGNKYLIIALEYNPSNDVLAWAGDVADAHPNHQVIMLTHSYLWRYGNRAGVLSGNTDPAYKNNGIEMWDKFVSQHENIIMTFSGHTHNNHIVRRVDQGVHGNDVYQILMDAQVADSWYKGIGMLGILRFNEDGTLCSVSYYSPLKDMCLFEDSVFTVQLPKQENKYSALVGLTSYETVTEAAANANGEIVKILKNTDEAIVINNDVTIDLAGYSLSNVTVSEGAKLNLIDSTATYNGTKGSATVTGNVEKLVEHDGKKYMVIGENGVYAPHRYYVGITHVSLDTATTGFGYKAQFRGDEAVQAQVANIGYDLWLTEDRVVTRTLEQFQNLVTLRLKNFDVVNYGEAPVNAKVFMTLVDGTKLESEVQSYSMRSMVEGINEAYESFSTEKLTAAAKMILKYETMESWNVANILAAMQPKAVVESVTVENQEMTIYGGSAATLTLTGANKFTVQDTVESLQDNPYANWIADYYVTMDAEAQEGLFLAGNYGSYGWIAIPVEAGKTYTNIPVVQTLLGTSLTYEEMVTQVVSFSCGVADTQSLNTGATVTVELRLTNPDDPTETIVIKTITLSL